MDRWVWSDYAEEIKPDRKSGSPVPNEYLINGEPYPEWIEYGFVKKVGSR